MFDRQLVTDPRSERVEVLTTDRFCISARLLSSMIARLILRLCRKLPSRTLPARMPAASFKAGETIRIKAVIPGCCERGFLATDALIHQTKPPVPDHGRFTRRVNTRLIATGDSIFSGLLSHPCRATSADPRRDLNDLTRFDGRYRIKPPASSTISAAVYGCTAKLSARE